VLIFLKMADDRVSLTGDQQAIPKSYRWSDVANPKLRATREVNAQEYGRASVVVPDSVLFEGGAGEKIRRKLLGVRGPH